MVYFVSTQRQALLLFCVYMDVLVIFQALIIENGAYGKRMSKICAAAGISCDVQSFREDRQVEPEVVEDALSGRTKYDLVAIVHSETSSGVFNPIAEVGNIVKSLSPG